MKIYRIAVHTGPLSTENFADMVRKLEGVGYLYEVTHGTERVYFKVRGSTIGDSIDARIAAHAALRQAFGRQTALQPVVSNIL